MLADNWGVLEGVNPRTPTFDRIAREGNKYDGAFAPNPSCSPSRSSLLTGLDSHRLGEAASLYGRLDPSIPTYTALLEKAGYFVGYTGKGWAPGTPANPGRNPAGKVFPSFEAFLAARPAGAPFCFWFGSHDPHVPWDRGRERKKTMNLAGIRIPAWLPNAPEVRDDIANYLCEVEEFDAECGQLVEVLETRGELDKTMVVMTSDNGWQMPRGLGNCYDAGVRIPMALRYPGRVHPQDKWARFTTLMDLAPTFLELAGIKAPEGMRGGCLYTGFQRDEVYLERERHANVRKGDLSYPIRGIRSREWLYLRNYEPDRWPAGDPELYWAVGPYGDVDDSPSKQLLLRTKSQPHFDLCMGKRSAEELYSVANDPDQVSNLAEHPAYAEVVAVMRKYLDGWMTATGDPRVKTPRTDFWDKAPYTGARAKPVKAK